MRAPIVALAWLALMPAALAQSLNIDVNRGPGSGAGGGVPSNAFAGAAGQIGIWNDVPATGDGPFPLVTLDGTPTGATFSRSPGATLVAFGNSQTTGDFDRLLDDAHGFVGSGSVTIAGLAPGPYTLITYALTPFEDLNWTFVTVPGSTSNNPQQIGGALLPNTLSQGVTHALHQIEVGPGGTITINMTHGGKSDLGVVNGLQLIQRNPARLYVKADANGANNGLSWNNAFTSLASALTAAAAPGSATTEIWIAAGSYRPTQRTNPAIARSATFPLRDNLTIRGGFFGNEITLSQRFDGTLPAVLSGDLGAQANPADNAYHVVTMSGPGSATLEAVTVSAGNANGAGIDADGAGVLVSGGSLVLDRVTLRDNAALGNGGGLAVLAGQALVTSTRIIDNTASSGGGVHAAAGASLSLVNATLAFNAGGVSCPGGCSVFNSIAWANTGPQISGPADVRHSCVQGGYAGAGNIAIDPRFENPVFRNLRPLPGSRVIDAGSNPLASAAGALDLPGLPRRMDDAGRPDTGVGPAPVIDMGAYEFQKTSPPTSCAGDANGDGLVNNADLSVLLGTFNQSVPTGSGADFNGDGAVNNADLSVLLGRWGVGC